MLSLATRPHAAMGDERLTRQTVFIKRSSVKRDALPRRLLGGNSHRSVSGKTRAPPRRAGESPPRVGSSRKPTSRTDSKRRPPRPSSRPSPSPPSWYVRQEPRDPPPRPRRKIRAERRNGRRLVPLACRFFFPSLASGFFFFCETMFFSRGEKETRLLTRHDTPLLCCSCCLARSLKAAFPASAAVDHVVAQTAAFSGADVLLRGALAVAAASAELRHRAPRLGNRNSGGDLGDGHLGCLRFARGDGGTARCDARPAGCAVRAKRRARARERRARGGAGGGDARRRWRRAAPRRARVRRGDGASAELVESLEHQIEALRVEMDEERVTGG